MAGQKGRDAQGVADQKQNKNKTKTKQKFPQRLSSAQKLFAEITEMSNRNSPLSLLEIKHRFSSSFSNLIYVSPAQRVLAVGRFVSKEMKSVSKECCVSRRQLPNIYF
jgi:hypothetical protein